MPDLKMVPEYQPTKPLPRKINGYPIFASYPIPGDKFTRASEVIAVDRGPDESPRWVVSRLYWDRTSKKWDSQWDSGDYCDTLEEAVEAYAERRRRALGM